MAALAACGGGGGGNGSVPVVGGTTPTPTPTPSPSPSATNPPTVFYSGFDGLVGDQTFQSACAGLTFTASPPVPRPATSFGNGLTLSYASLSGIYSLSGDGLGLNFVPSELDATSTATTRIYVKSSGERLSIGRPAPGGTALDHARAITVNARPAGLQAAYQCVVGETTIVADIPATTSTLATTYGKTIIGGTIYDGSGSPVQLYTLTKSAVTMSINWATRRVDVSVQLVGTPAATSTATADKNFGTLTGTATLDATGAFYGNWTSSLGAVTGQFGGKLFGPQGKEVGIASSFQTGSTASIPNVVSLATIYASR